MSADEKRVEPTEEDRLLARDALFEPCDECSLPEHRNLRPSWVAADIIAQALAAQRARLVEEHEKEVAALREIVAEYREQDRLTSECFIGPAIDDNEDQRCAVCIKADATLLAFRAAGREKEPNSSE